MNSAVLCLLAAVINYFSFSNSFPILLEKAPTSVEKSFVWDGNKYNFRYAKARLLTIDTTGTKEDLDKAIEYGLQLMDNEKETTYSNIDLPKNTITHENPSNINVDRTYRTDWRISKNEKERLNTDGHVIPVYQVRLIFDKNKETINVGSLSPELQSKTYDADKIIFPTERTLDYDQFVQIPSDIDIFNRMGVPPAVVASLLG